MAPLNDPLGRRFEYLRLSVTDVCNFKCFYCLPYGYRSRPNQSEFLSVDEIGRLVRGFADLGLWKVRLTGGEPTTRSDIIKVVETVRDVVGVRKVALSTNGYRLRSIGSNLVDAGVTAFNVSVDSLDPEVFQRATGMDRLQEVLGGIDLLLGETAAQIKLNVVLMKGVNDSEAQVTSFLEWARFRPVSVRWIEWMRTGDQAFEDFNRFHVSAGSLRLFLLRQGWRELKREGGAGPAVEFAHPDYLGRVGLIAPYAEGFCTSCNRLRVTSRGALKLCLFGTGQNSLREYLQLDDQKEDLKQAVSIALLGKTAGHGLHRGDYGETGNLSLYGG